MALELWQDVQFSHSHRFPHPPFLHDLHYAFHFSAGTKKKVIVAILNELFWDQLSYGWTSDGMKFLKVRIELKA